MRVLLLGASGMLGHAVYKDLREKYDLTITTRKAKKDLLGEIDCQYLEFDVVRLLDDATSKRWEYFPRFVEAVGDVDYVVNAIGVINIFANRDPANSFFVNAALPHILARQYKTRLIHISTDCVYDAGPSGPYDENAPLAPKDLYGVTKSLGEPKDCLTIRTSIIGQELDSRGSLIDWFLHQPTDKPISGYTNHLWNGITTRQYARVCDKVMSARISKAGVFHVFTNVVSKYDMLVAFRKKFGIRCEIVPVEANPPVDRRLSTIYDFNSWLQIPSFEQMVEEM